MPDRQPDLPQYETPPVKREPVPTVAEYLAAVLIVAVASLGTMAINRWMGTSVSILFFPAVLLTAMYWGYGPALLASGLSALSLAYFFIEPTYSFDIGPDDAIRLGAFAVVAVVTAYVSSARKNAEDAQKKALAELRGALNTLQKVSGWPMFVDAGLAGGAAKLLAHAASVVGSTEVVAVWEAEDEPWAYLASAAIRPSLPTETGEAAASADVIARYAPSELDRSVPVELEQAAFVSGGRLGDNMTLTVSRGGSLSEWRGRPFHPEIAIRLSGSGLASAPFEVERLKGRLFFSGVGAASPDSVPLVEVVAHEVGNSLERLHLQDRLQVIAIREDRVRLARDLHDGVLQSLTGIRLRLQSMADDDRAPASLRDNLLAVERAIAIEQRELRTFIEDLKPVARPAVADGVVANGLEAMRARLAEEWGTNVIVRVTPPDLSLPAASDQTLRLMVREAVVNALKHAGPSRVSVDVQKSIGNVLVTVSNDGRGFPFRGRMEHAQLIAANAGPVSLRERLISVGGSLAIESTAAGAQVEMILPI